MIKIKYKYKVAVLVLVVLTASLACSVFSSSLFEGQHTWYDLSAPENDVSCYKCHKNIRAEFDETPSTLLPPGSGVPHKDKSCEYCHRSEPGVTYANGSGKYSEPGEEAHAASVPLCQQCHEHESKDLAAADESHKPLNRGGGSSSAAESNEACVLCHTGFDKSIDFTRPLYVEYEIKNVSGTWLVHNFNLGPSSTATVNLTPPGERHTWKNASAVNCFDCHSDIKNALENGGHVPSSGKTLSGTAVSGHKGRRHNFSRTSTGVSVEDCKPCHRPSLSDFGAGYNHLEARLDYHAATTEHCYDCHYNGTATAFNETGSGCVECHNILRTPGKHTEILNSTFSQNFCGYKIDKVCVGCHLPGPGTSVPFSDRNFTIYTELNTTIFIN